MPLTVPSVVLSPTTSAKNTIQPTSDVKALVVKGVAGQTANLYEARDSSGATALVQHTAAGNIVAAGTLTIGADATLTRTAANTIRVGSGTLILDGPNSQVLGTFMNLTGDARFAQNSAANQIRLGTASGITFGSAEDAALARTAAGQLTIQHGTLPNPASLVLKASATQSATLTASTSTTPASLVINAGFVEIGNLSTRKLAFHEDLGDDIGFGVARDTNIARTAAGELTVQSRGAFPTKLIVKGTASQGATNHFEVQNSSGTPIAAVASGGAITAAAGSAQQIILGDSVAAVEFSNARDTKLQRVAAGVLGLYPGGSGLTAPTMTGAGFMLRDVTTAPSTNPVGGGVLYSDAGALKWRGTAGTVTTIAAA